MLKTVVLAGGFGTRLAEETDVRPKPMVEIGGYPILWHIMKIYSYYGYKEFFIALGYKGHVIKQFFLDHFNLSGNISINYKKEEVSVENHVCEDWIVHLIDTGLETYTGGRVKRLEPFLKNETFMVTYGDGVSNINIQSLIDFHRSHGKIATVTAVRPPARFGGLIFKGDMVIQFTEKPQTGEGWINGGFFVFEPEIFRYLEGDHTSLEADLLERLAAEGQLVAYKHDKFWQCMDTLRDKHLLERLWQNGEAPWKVWNE